jgi:hypothetical protein
MDDPVLKRVCRQVGMPGLVERLSSRVSASDLQTVILELARDRARRRRPTDILMQYARDGTVRPDLGDARLVSRLAVAAFESAPAFDAVELAPVEPLGVNSVLTGLDQNNVLATARGTEVVADPTIALALHAASRRRAGVDLVRACACPRVLRPQSSNPLARRHFRLFALVSAARSQADHRSETAALREHVAAHLAIGAAAREAGAAVDHMVVRVSDTDIHKALSRSGVTVRPDVAHPHDAMPAAVVRRLGRRLRRLEAAIDALTTTVGVAADARLLVDLTRTDAVGYYQGLQLRIDAIDGGVSREVADGGSVDWAARLLSDRREQLFTSGVGLERLLSC